MRSGAWERRQRTYRPGGKICSRGFVALSARVAAKLSEGSSFAGSVHRPRCQEDYSPASVANGQGSVGKRAPRQPTHVAAQLRHPHGRKRSGPAYCTNHSRARGHFDYADLYARCSRSTEKRVSKTSSEGQGEMRVRQAASETRKALGNRNPTPVSTACE